MRAQGRVFEIVKLGGEVIGTLRVSAFHKEDSWEDYGGFHDEMRGRNGTFRLLPEGGLRDSHPSRSRRAEGADKAELDAFSKLFTKKGYFKREVSSGGLGTFGREVTNEPYLVLLDTVRVKPEYREKGVGTWAVKKLFELGEEDFLFYDEAKEKKKAEEEDERKAKAPQGTPGLDSYYGSGFLESLFKKRARRVRTRARISLSISLDRVPSSAEHQVPLRPPSLARVAALAEPRLDAHPRRPPQGRRKDFEGARPPLLPQGESAQPAFPLARG